MTPFRTIKQLTRKAHHFLTHDIDDSPLPEAFARSIQNPGGVLEHIVALRKHLIRIVLYLIITTAISFIFITPILEFLARPLEGGLASLQAIDVTEGVGTVMRVALLSGFAMASLFIAFEVWLFVAEGLKPGARLFTLFAIPLAALFFLSGLAFAYFFILPTALPVLQNFMGISSLWRPHSYFPFVTSLMFWMGISFEFPLVIFILARLGIVSHRDLIAQWRLAIVIISIVSAAITTTTDPVNMSLVMLPMSVLYFISIGLALLANKRQIK